MRSSRWNISGGRVFSLVLLIASKVTRQRETKNPFSLFKARKIRSSNSGYCCTSFISAQGNLEIEFDLLHRFQISFHSLSMGSDIGFKRNKLVTAVEGNS